jgi:hypothetical protein
LTWAGFQALTLWQAEHCPLKWLAGLFFAWQEEQSVKPLWLKLAGVHARVVWQLEHCPGKWFAGRLRV